MAEPAEAGLEPTSAAADPAAAETGPECQLGSRGCFSAVDGTLVLEDPAYRALIRRDRPHYLRAAVANALALGAGTTWYWIDRERQVADWDFPSWRERISLDVWRMDNNPFGINFIGHPLNGAGFHVLSRANDLSLAGSVGYGIATSMFWEYALEYREKVSINDVIVTTGAGIAIGEFFHWLGRYSNSRPPGRQGAGHAVARWTAGLTYALHDVIDGEQRVTDVPADSLGFRSDIWHRFDVSYGLARADVGVRDGDTRAADATVHALRAQGRLVALPGYLRPGRFARFFADGNVTAAEVEVQAGGGSGLGFAADTTLVGWHWQDISRAGAGHAITVGPAVAFRYRRDEVGPWEDRLGLMHLPGPAVDLALLGGLWRLEARGRVHGDFAGLHALSSDRWHADNPDAGGKQILEKHGYYYGWGVSARGELVLTLPHVAVGVSGLYGRYDSQEGLDRHQEERLVDQELTDVVVDRDAWLRVRRGGAYLELRAAQRRRQARFEDLRARQSLDRYELRAGVVF